jgi:hypothetical protein
MRAGRAGFNGLLTSDLRSSYDHAMPQQTMLTLDDDVARQLADEARETGQPVQAVANELLRRGMTRLSAEVTRRPFRVQARTLGLRPGVSLECAETLLDELDGPQRR